MKALTIAVVTVAIALANPAVAAAAEITVFTARAVATVLAEIGGEFERATGHTLIVVSDLPTGFLRRVNAGESFDLLISGSVPVDEWIRDGRLVAATRTVIARSAIGVEVRAGAPKPDISTVDAFKRALLNAKSIAYLRVGSGVHLEGLFKRLGIEDAIRSKVTRPDSDIVSELVAKGEVELGMTVITQILTTPGVDLVGPLPSEVQSYVTFVAAVGVKSRSKDAASELIRFLEGSRAIGVITSQGMEPGTGRLPRSACGPIPPLRQPSRSAGGLLSGSPLAVQSPADRSSDEAAIRTVVRNYVNARDLRDPAAIQAIFTADADQHTTSGEWRRGRAAVIEGSMESSKRNPGKRTITVETIRFITPDVAMADGPYEIRADGGVRRMWTTIVLEREEGAWRIAAIRNMAPTTAAPGPPR